MPECIVPENATGDRFRIFRNFGGECYRRTLQEIALEYSVSRQETPTGCRHLYIWRCQKILRIKGRFLYCLYYFKEKDVQVCQNFNEDVGSSPSLHHDQDRLHWNVGTLSPGSHISSIHSYPIPYTLFYLKYFLLLQIWRYGTMDVGWKV